MSQASSMLMKLCTENLYADNIFHLLGVSIMATPRQIRRKREDFDSAKIMGRESWEREFRHIMGNRSIPTQDEINDAFGHLEDPEYRIVSEFFWVWPTSDEDVAINDLFLGRKRNALQKWEQDALSVGKKRLIAQHNLAVLYHFYALDAELQILACDDYVPEEFRKAMCSYWDKAFAYWENLADNDDFWSIYESRMRAFDDPRLTDRFLRTFRAEFPIAFDNINALVAARYAKLSRFEDAKRHIEYMSRTMSGLDDVQENMNIIFTPMEHRIDLLVDGYETKVKVNPIQGLECANKLLEETEEIRRIAKGLLKENQRIRTGIFTKIVSACNRFLVAYGNKTEDWNDVLKVLVSLHDIACTPDSKKIVESNIETVKNNIKYEETESRCWFCKTEKASTHFDLRMYGDVQRTFNQKRWRSLVIPIPSCEGCCRRFSITRIILNIIMPFTLIAAVMAGSAADSWLVGVGVVVLMIVTYAFLSADNKCEEYPAVKAAKEKGFRVGEHP